MNSYPAATVACFDPTCGELPRRSLDKHRLSAFLNRLAVAGADAVLIGSSTGQGHLRTIAELEAMFRAAAVTNTEGAKKMALLRPEDGLEANRQLIALLQSLAYSVVFFRPGTDLPADASDSQVVSSLQPLVEEAARLGLAVGLYSISDVSGLPLTPDVVANLVAAPGGEAIVAVKVTEADYELSTLKYLQDERLKHLFIVQGWDPHMARALKDGPKFSEDGSQRCGVTSGPMSFAVYQYLHILEAAGRGDWDEVEQAQSAVTALFASMQDDPRKFADLQRAKYLMGLGHPLLDSVSDQQIDSIFAALSGVARKEDRDRLARSLDLMGDGPHHERLTKYVSS